MTPNTTAVADPAADLAVAWTPLRLRGLTVPNRVWLSPMCQYSADDQGRPTAWHLAHYGGRAAGGVGLAMVEATGVAPDMRTTVRDLGLWSEPQVEAHRRLADAIRALGSIPAIQLGLAGRKSSHGIPWDNAGTRRAVLPRDGGWQPLAPSPIRFPGLTTPRAMTGEDIDRVLGDVAHAAHNAHRAGYEALGLQASNGYLFHQFLSPLSNRRTDRWGGDPGARRRFPLAVVSALRSGWPAEKPLVLRVPASDLIDGGLDVGDVAVLVRRMVDLGVDVVDLNAGALTPDAARPSTPLENLRFAGALRAPGMVIASSGGVSGPEHLRAVPDRADALFVGRALLRDPYWALRARGGPPEASWPRPYLRAF